MLGIGLDIFQPARAAQSWTPFSLFGAGDKGFWINAEDTGAIFTDDLGTTPVAADNDPVGRANGRTASGPDFIQANTSRQPSYRTTVSPTHIAADGNSDILSGAPFAYSGGNMVMIAAVRSVAASAARFFCEGSTTSNNQIYSIGSDNVGGTYPRVFMRTDANSVRLDFTSAIPVYDDIWHILTAIDTGSQFRFRIDGAEAGSTSYTRSGALTPNNSTLFGWQRVGKSHFIPAWINQVLVISGAVPSDADIAKTEAHFAAKAGISL